MTVANRWDIGADERVFTVGIDKAAQAKHQFRAGDIVTGTAQPVADEKTESVEYYKASGMMIAEEADFYLVSWQIDAMTSIDAESIRKLRPTNSSRRNGERAVRCRGVVYFSGPGVQTGCGDGSRRRRRMPRISGKPY